MTRHYIWSAIQRFGTQGIGFVGNVLIARQLSPDDYGLIAMLAIFMSIAMNFTESGFADYLVRDPNATNKDFSIVFVHNIVFGVLFYMLLFFTAPLIANFYGRIELIDITRILGLNIIIKSLSLSEFTRLRKELKFKNLSIIQLISYITGIGIGYSMALTGWGYWALVVQTLCISLMSLLMIVIITKWTPTWYFNWMSYKAMRKFGNNMLVSYFTNQIGSNLYSVFIGKVYSSMTLGFYNQAEKINKISFQSVNGIVLTTSYAILAKEQDKSKRRNMYIGLLNHFLFIHLSISAFLMGVAEPFMGFVFGEQWLPTAPLLQLVLLSFLMQPFVTVNQNIVKIENRPDIYRNLTFLRNGLVFIALLFTYRYTVELIIVGQMVARFLSAIIDVLVCGKFMDFGFEIQFKALLKQVWVPLISAICAYSVMVYLNSNYYFFHLTVFVLSFVILFIILNIASKNSTFYLFMNKIRSLKLNKN